MRALSPADAADLIRDGDTVAVCGVVSLSVPEAILKALERRFLHAGKPTNLTVIGASRPGWDPNVVTGIEHFGHAGLTRRLITSTFNDRTGAKIVELSLNNQISTYFLPMGTLFRWLREVAAGSPGLLTEVGLDSYLDPTVGESGDPRAHPDAAPLDIVQRLEIGGQPCLLYKRVPIDVAIIRGTVADTHGNISVAGEPVNAGVRHLAMAAHNSDGLVIAQVKHLTEAGTLHPRLVEVPGIWVDVVVVDSGSQQSCLDHYEPAFVGDTRLPDPPLSPPPLGARKIILRRVAEELRAGEVLNLGYGIPNQLAALAHEEGFADQVIFTVEQGVIGGLPGPQEVFGAHYNPEAIIDQSDMFSFYDGGGLDVAILGFAQVDARGNVCNSRFGGRLRGPGGMLNILHRTPTILFCGTITAGGLEVGTRLDTTGSRSQPSLEIAKEGRFHKFVKRVENLDFSGQAALSKQQRVLFITERAVFRLAKEGLVLDEIAPGIDIDRDIRPVVEFDFLLNPSLQVMDFDLFTSAKRHYRLASPQEEGSLA